MRVISCILIEHNLWLVVLSLATCIVGCSITLPLWRRALKDEGHVNLDWCFLAAVTGGSSIWATHFIAMLGYQPAAPVTFDAAMTVASALIVILGTGLGIAVASAGRSAASTICGGGLIGLSIAAMHYVGMFAYRVDGIVAWSTGYIVLSLLAVAGGSTLAVHLARRRMAGAGRHAATAALVGTIVALHFLGMAAFAVAPMPGVPVGTDSEAFIAMAIAVALVALVMMGTGLSSNLIAERLRASSDQLDHIARHDALTGLANRRHFMEVLTARCAAAHNGDQQFVLLMIDLDRFKAVNDTLGHQAGDAILRCVAERLATAAGGVEGADCLIARLGGDEFAILTSNHEDQPDQAEELAACVVKAMTRPFLVDGKVAEIGASIGVARAPRDGTSPEQLSQHADMALYSVKEAGRNGFRLFDVAMAEKTQLQRGLEADLRQATALHELEVHYQPLVDARTGTFTGAEALARWRHPTRGWVPPTTFIPLAEELGLIGQIGAVILRQACRDATTWSPHLSVAVNLSATQLLDPGLPQAVAGILAETGLKPTRLVLEITETGLIGNNDLALATLQALVAQGVSIALDDFGIGYSSLSYLSRFPISAIKIDQSFVQRMPVDPDTGSIVRAIAQLGQTLGMKVTAEGVETMEQREAMAMLGCDFLQGYLFSRPVPARKLVALWDRRSAQAA